MALITLSDLARDLQISPSTVSRALADHPHINEATKRRVREAAERAGYRPNRLARGLRAGHTRTLGLVILDIGDQFYTEIARGAEDAALAHGYLLILCNADNTTARADACVDMLSEQQVDGLLITPSDHALARRAADRVAHVVLIDTGAADSALSSVSVDHMRGTREAIEHLLGLGHRRIGFVNWTLEAPHCAAAQRGVLETLAEHGIAMPAELLRIVERPDAACSAEATRVMLALPEPPTAVFAFGDIMAYGVMMAAQAAGLVVPRDLSVVGYDDIPLAQHLLPPLTTIRQDTYQIGRIAADLLIREMGDTTLRQRIVVPARLIVRASSAPPSATRLGAIGNDANKRQPRRAGERGGTPTGRGTTAQVAAGAGDTA